MTTVIRSLKPGYRSDKRPWKVTDELVLDVIRAHLKEHGWPPTVREIGTQIDRSVECVHKSLERLQDDGRIVRGPRNGPRMIRIVEP